MQLSVKLKYIIATLKNVKHMTDKKEKRKTPEPRKVEMWSLPKKGRKAA